MYRIVMIVALVLTAAAGFAPVATADVPNCDCLPNTPYEWIWCPGEQNSWSLQLFSDDNCTVPLAFFSCIRAVFPDTACACPGYPYPVYPVVTDVNGWVTFTWRGTAQALPERRTGYLDQDPMAIQVCGCQDIPIYVRSPDLNTNCEVDLADFVIFSQAFKNLPNCPPPAPPFSNPLWCYTVYTGHLAPCRGPQLADFVVFAQHFGDSCTNP